MRVDTFFYTHTCMQTLTHTHTHTNTYTYMHTHTTYTGVTVGGGVTCRVGM